MGGDRTCPDDCLIGAWHSLPDDQKTLTRRRPIVEQLRKQGYSQEVIATQLGVDQATISRDLEALCIVHNAASPRKDKLGRPNTGRPRRLRMSETAVAEAAAEQIVDKRKSYVQTEREVEFSNTVLRSAVAREEGRREMLEKLLDAAAAKNFTDKGKLRIEDAIRVHQKNLNRIFEQQVNEEVRRRIVAADDATRADNKRLRAENLTLSQIVNERGVFTEQQFKGMQKLCHPDAPASLELRSELIQILNEKKQRLIKLETRRNKGPADGSSS
jgi:IS30 family transposase